MILLLIFQGNDKNVVIMPLKKFGFVQETLYLVNSNINKKRLDEAIDEMQSGKFSRHKLSEDSFT